MRLLSDAAQAPGASVSAYQGRGGYAALHRALGGELTPAQVIGEVRASGLRGRGGAGVLTAEKLALVAQRADTTRYVVANAYDADERSAISRTLLTRDPHRVIEGILLAAYAVGAREAFLFMRATPPEAAATVQDALRQATDQGLVGETILGSDFSCAVTAVGVDLGFMAGEETVALEVLKGRRAMPQQRPPYPTQYGLYDEPTAVLNAETLANLPAIVARGGPAFARVGMAGDPGTKLFTVITQAAGNGAGAADQGTLVEVPIGVPIREALRLAGAQVSDSTTRAVVVGGLEGAALPLNLLDTPLAFDKLEAVGAIMGSGVLEVLPAATCMVDWAANRSARLSRESCGKCVPCRVGVKRIAGTLEGIKSDIGDAADLTLLEEFAHYVPDGSLCGFGVNAVNPIVSAMKYFAADFTAHLEGRCPTGVCLPVRAHRYVTKHVL
jgi:NADH-quinone oxidoreductase subunit F